MDKQEMEDLMEQTFNILNTWGHTLAEYKAKRERQRPHQTDQLPTDPYETNMGANIHRSKRPLPPPTPFRFEPCTWKAHDQSNNNSSSFAVHNECEYGIHRDRLQMENDFMRDIVSPENQPSAIESASIQPRALKPVTVATTTAADTTNTTTCT